MSNCRNSAPGLTCLLAPNECDFKELPRWKTIHRIVGFFNQQNLGNGCGVVYGVYLGAHFYFGNSGTVCGDRRQAGCLCPGWFRATGRHRPSLQRGPSVAARSRCCHIEIIDTDCVAWGPSIVISHGGPTDMAAGPDTGIYFLWHTNGSSAAGRRWKEIGRGRAEGSLGRPSACKWMLRSLCRKWLITATLLFYRQMIPCLPVHRDQNRIQTPTTREPLVRPEIRSGAVGGFPRTACVCHCKGVTSDLPVLTLLVPGRRIPVFPRSEGRLEKGPLGLRVVFMGQWLILLPSFCGPFKELNARVHVFRLVFFIFFSITV